MPIIRTRLDFEQRNFTRIPNDYLRDTKISLRAKGLLAQLLSHSPGWAVSVRNLAEVNGCGSHAITVAIHELEEAGYLVRQQDKGSDGRFEAVSWLTKDPGSETISPVFDSPQPEYPTPEDPTPENQHTKKTITQKTKEQKTIEQKTTGNKPTTIPDDFQITEEMRQWATEKVPGLDIDFHTEMFCDYWRSRGRDNTKRDWVAAWRNWLRKTYSDQKPRNATPRLSNAQRNLLELQQRMKGALDE